MSETSIPFVLGEEPARARECDCRAPGLCVHWNGRVLSLRARAAAPGGWRVGVAEQDAPFLSATGRLLTTLILDTFNYDEALAAFNETEERLLRGEPS